MHPPSHEPAGVKIILLEDNPYDAELIQVILEASLVCRVTILGSRAELLKELEQAAPEVVVSDSSLPCFEGSEAINLVRQKCPGVPFVFCCGNQSPALRERGLQLGAAAWVSKDNLPHLVAVVKRLCQTGEQYPSIRHG